MPTGQQIITNSLIALNVIDAGGSVSGSENADLLTELNTMLDGWVTDETLIPSIATAQYALVGAQNPYVIGPGGADFNVPRPVRIEAAYQVSTIAGGKTRKPIRIVGSKTYFAHGDLAAAASTIDELYPDWTD